MLLKNNTTKIIGIGTTTILPGEIGDCPAGYENNPVVKQYINGGTFDVVGTTLEEKVVIPAPEGMGNSLEEMTEEELMRYAEEQGVELGRATTKEGILKKIQETQKA